MLSKHQEDFFNLIKDFYKEKEELPTLNELLKLSNYKSYNSIYKYLNILENKGYLTFDKSRKQVSFINGVLENKKFILVPIINKDSYLYLDKKLFKEKGNFFAFKLSNNSLESFFIKKGDILIVKQDNHYLDNKLVVVKIDKRLNVYKYSKKDGFCHLENDLDTLILNNEKRIMGKIILIIRSN